MMSVMVCIDDTGSSIHGKNIRVLFFSLGKAGSARRRCSPQVLLGFLSMQQHVYVTSPTFVSLIQSTTVATSSLEKSLDPLK